MAEFLERLKPLNAVLLALASFPGKLPHEDDESPFRDEIKNLGEKLRVVLCMNDKMEVGEWRFDPWNPAMLRFEPNVRQAGRVAAGIVGLIHMWRYYDVAVMVLGDSGHAVKFYGVEGDGPADVHWQNQRWLVDCAGDIIH
jgi:hypothetical protein